VILVAMAGIMVWLLWGAIRARHWAWPWRALSGAIGIVLLLFFAMLAAVLQHGLEDARAVRYTFCRMNLMNIGRAIQMYASENDDRAPLSNWTDALAGYAGRDPYRCPMTDSPYAFTMNPEFVGAIFPGPRPTAPVVFDGPGGRNSVGGVEFAVYRHEDGTAQFLLASGWVKALRVGEKP
jgi:hypothetical protein